MLQTLDQKGTPSDKSLLQEIQHVLEQHSPRQLATLIASRLNLPSPNAARNLALAFLAVSLSLSPKTTQESSPTHGLSSNTKASIDLGIDLGAKEVIDLLDTHRTGNQN